MKQNYLTKKQITKIKKKARKYADLFDEITKILNEDKEMDIRELSNLIDELKDLKGEDLYKNNIKEISTMLGVDIKIVYKAPYQKEGMIFSGIGCIMLLQVMILDIKKRKK